MYHQVGVLSARGVSFLGYARVKARAQTMDTHRSWTHTNSNTQIKDTQTQNMDRNIPSTHTKTDTLKTHKTPTSTHKTGTLLIDGQNHTRFTAKHTKTSKSWILTNTQVCIMGHSKKKYTSNTKTESNHQTPTQIMDTNQYTHRDHGYIQKRHKSGISTDTYSIMGTHIKFKHPKHRHTSVRAWTHA